MFKTQLESQNDNREKREKKEKTRLGDFFFSFISLG